MAASNFGARRSSFQYWPHVSPPYLMQHQHSAPCSSSTPAWMLPHNQSGRSQRPYQFSSQIPVQPFAGVHCAVDPHWYPDTGATHHMTAMPVNNAQPYAGPHNVYMGNGASMSVSHTGNLPMSLGSSTFSLQNVFHIPSIQKNLFSVARFTKDNLVFFLFCT